MIKLEICIEEIKEPPHLFWFLIFDGKVINYTPRLAEKYKGLYEGLIILNNERINPQEMTTDTLIIFKEAMARLQQKRESDFYSSPPNTKENTYYIKSIDYLEGAIKIANEIDEDVNQESIVKR